MTTTRTLDHATAKANWLAARIALTNATSRKAKRDAMEAIELWSGRMAMLANTKGWA